MTQPPRHRATRQNPDASPDTGHDTTADRAAHEAPVSVPDPLVAAHVDLRDFPYMPLDVVRLRDSSLAVLSSGEEFRCAVLLWCASWHQVPAGSLPLDDLLLAQLAGFGRAVREWRKVKRGALRGWVECADGRIYHPVVAEKAAEAWDERLKQRYRTECARIKKVAQRAGLQWNYPTYDQWLTRLESTGQEQWRPDPVHGDNPPSPEDVPGETASKGREGKGREGNIEALPQTTRADVPTQGASAHALALRGVGYSDCSPHHPDLIAAKAEGITPEELADAARSKPGKSVAYVVERARGRRADALERKGQERGGAHSPAPPPDPEATARADLERQVDDRIRQIRNDCDHLGLIDQAERDRRIGEVRELARSMSARAAS